jgi:hypothetical protein
MSIEDEIRRKHASLEQSVRERQRFEEMLREFLSIACGMTNSELEITLARLADSLQAANSKPDSIRIKGRILNTYYQLRAAGLKQQSTRTRLILKINATVGTLWLGTFSEYLISKLAQYRLPEIPQAANTPYASDDAFDAHIKLLAP